MKLDFSTHHQDQNHYRHRQCQIVIALVSVIVLQINCRSHRKRDHSARDAELYLSDQRNEYMEYNEYNKEYTNTIVVVTIINNNHKEIR